MLGLPTVCWARARVSVLPSPYDTYSLALAPGQLVRVVRRSEGGLWWGEAGGRAGRLKFVNLTVLEEEPGGGQGGQEAGERAGEQEQAGVTGLLASLGLEALATRLSLNGFDSLARLEGLTRWEGRVMARATRQLSLHPQGGPRLPGDPRQSRPADSPGCNLSPGEGFWGGQV